MPAGTFLLLLAASLLLGSCHATRRSLRAHNISSKVALNVSTGGQYSDIQTVFLLNKAASAVMNISDSAKNLVNFFKIFLNGDGSNPRFPYKGFFPMMADKLWGAPWTVVWGPAVFLFKDPGLATNAMFVAYSPSVKTYVVSIAGTNQRSLVDWLFEDLNVQPSKAQPFSAVSAAARATIKSGNRQPSGQIHPGAYVSAGTATGVAMLVNMASDFSTLPDGSTQQNLNFATFLNLCQSTSSHLIFTGHSLGGALSPTLAAALYPDGYRSPLWASVRVLPTAGPTPGNGDFSRWFNSVYPATAVDSGTPKPSAWTGDRPTWNTNIVNGQDPVPRAWNNLDSLATWKAFPPSYPTLWGYANWVAGPLMTGAVVTGNDLLEGRKDFYSPINTLYGLLQCGASCPPLPAAGWQMLVWSQTSSGVFKYPPGKKDLPPCNYTNPFTKADIMDLVIATHIDQYYDMFGVVPLPQMAPFNPPNFRPKVPKKEVAMI